LYSGAIRFEATTDECIALPSAVRPWEVGNDVATGAATGAAPATGGSGGKTRMSLVKGVSVQAERFARGLDSALDFVDGRVGFGTV